MNMVTTHNLGFPRMGARRELKFALEAYWGGRSTRDELVATGTRLRQAHWQQQAALDLVPVGDFAFYDQVLDMSFTLGHLPQRVQQLHADELDKAFHLARGRSAPTLQAVHEAHDGHGCCAHSGIQAGEMTKWFDTNYHHIVPEFTADTRFALNATRLLSQVAEARALGLTPKPVIIGPVTYLWLGKSKDGTAPLDLLPQLLPVYAQLLDALAQAGVEWVQVDEPALVTELDADWRHAYQLAYHHLKACRTKLLLATYFGTLGDQLHLAATLPVAGLHVDATVARHELPSLLNVLPGHKVLSVGAISGRNVWKTDLQAALAWLKPLHERLGQRLWLAPSCSLLHVPVDLQSEHHLDAELRSWLAFALQKLDELRVLATALNHGEEAVQHELAANQQAIASRRASPRVHKPAVQAAVAQHADNPGQRHSPYAQRAPLQAQHLKLPAYPTTTIGSFPQTPEIRQARQRFKQGELDAASYEAAMRAEIARAVHEQEALGLDVLVHGEAERNDMVEYFGEQLDGYAFSQYGWVQSYGSRCVKPPILFGDIHRPQAMTVAWTRHAQSLTNKPMKGMLTGPVTMLNWSFVRDDQPRADTCRQLALAIRDEVLELEQAGVHIIQIDEAALREGLPLKRSEWDTYLAWAVGAFRLAANAVQDGTQIHTHMCYSDFTDIMPAIAQMDADVITIETSRSQMALLQAFDDFAYPNEIGPGVYDIHSPNIPSRDQIVSLMREAARRIPAERLWVNPDCGLKTRQWREVRPALQHMVAAAKLLRAEQHARQAQRA